MKLLLEAGLVVFAGLGVLFFGTGDFWSATWLSKWAFLMGLSLCLTCLWAAKKTSLAHLPLMLYVTLGLLALAAWPQHPYQHTYDAVTLLALQKNAFYALGEVLMAIVVLAICSRAAIGGFGIIMPVIWGVGITATLLDPSPPDHGLWFGNPSMGASLLACLLPTVWVWRSKLWKVVAWGLTFLAIYRTKASVPWGVLGVVSIAFVASKLLNSTSMKKALMTSLIVGSFLALAMIGGGEHFLGHDFWDQNGRFEIWSMAWNWFWDHAYPSIGQGYSTSQVFLPIEQMVTQHFHGSYFLWLHNDWLQLAIEGGYIGMACVFLSLLRFLKIAYKAPPMFGMLMGFITLGLFNYPLRMPIHSFCLVMLCACLEAKARSEKTSGTPQKALKKSRLEPALASATV